jgi:hypothetical protein
VNRRGFLQSILAAGVAPAVVGSGVLMPVRLVTPILREVEVVVDTELVVYGNTLLTVSAITREALRILERELVLQHEVNAEYLKHFDAAFDGLTVRRRPAA